MELEVTDNTKNKLIVEIKGEDHTLCNTIRDQLNEEPDVKAAGYHIAHPLTSNPRLTVVTASSSKPAKAILSAAKKLRKTNDKFLKDIKKF